MAKKKAKAKRKKVTASPEDVAAQAAISQVAPENVETVPEAPAVAEEAVIEEVSEVPKDAEVQEEVAIEETNNLPDGVVLGQEPTKEDEDNQAKKDKEIAEKVEADRLSRLDELVKTRESLKKALRMNKSHIASLENLKPIKWVYFYSPDGRSFKVPGLFIAKDYASRTQNGLTEEENTYDAVRNPAILEDHLKDEMNWFSISEKVIQYTPNRDTAIDQNWQRLIVSCDSTGDVDA